MFYSFDSTINGIKFDFLLNNNDKTWPVSELPFNKRKIINDPVLGFISFPFEIIYDLVEHPYFQRLRRIKQLGLTNYVYPGTNHTRFQHALGACYLMGSAIQVIRSKGHDITGEEAEAVMIAILLHDIGHGPFSHALENSIISDLQHEELSLLFMEQMNDAFSGRLDLAIEIFKNRYHKRFLHQLVSSQLDMDRLDYLRRDSFFSGVTEGVIGSDRIIKMLNVKDDQLVIDIKGIYSIEKFLIARRLMYWQVYFHKTVISAESLLVMILKRAKELAMSGTNLFTTPALGYFLSHAISGKDFSSIDKARLIMLFSRLDDNDVIASSKVWCDHDDKILSALCDKLVNRRLFRIEMRKETFSDERIELVKNLIMEKYGITENEARYFYVNGSISNHAYNYMDDRIKIMQKNGDTVDITEASDMLNVSVFSSNVTKHFLCYPKEFKHTF